MFRMYNATEFQLITKNIKMNKKSTSCISATLTVGIKFSKFPCLVLWCHAFDFSLRFLKGARFLKVG